MEKWRYTLANQGAGEAPLMTRGYSATITEIDNLQIVELVDAPTAIGH